MTRADQRWQVNRKEIAAKVIDGEAVMINLTSGTYFSMDNAGAAAWMLLASGHTVAETAQRIARHYGVDDRKVADDMLALVKQLEADNLLRPARDLSAATESVTLEPTDSRPYETPVLNKYSDMGDVLALDPPLPELKEESWTGAPTTN